MGFTTVEPEKGTEIHCTYSGENIFSAENPDKAGFRRASQVTPALASIEKIGILDKNQEWKIHDPFFRRWLLSGHNSSDLFDKGFRIWVGVGEINVICQP